uniref:Uncharacterized protein n=1 Tax=Arundo donax TaxID=35708 RepID=A0A0A9DBX0_ARUDO
MMEAREVLKSQRVTGCWHLYLLNTFEQVLLQSLAFLLEIAQFQPGEILAFPP